MKKIYWQWTKEECEKEAQKYQTRTDFRRENQPIYDYIRRKGWFKEICGHLTNHNAWRKNNSEAYRKWRKNWRDRNKEHLLEYGRKERFKRIHGIDISEYNNKVKRQKNKCAICGKHKDEQNKALALDHNHKTNQIRDLLCANCNAAIGFFNDNINVMMSAIRYLNKHNKLENPNIINEKNKKRFTITVYLQN